MNREGIQRPTSLRGLVGRPWMHAATALLMLVLGRTQASAAMVIRERIASDTVYVGQPFEVQFSVANVDRAPVLGGMETIRDFVVQPLPTSNNSSQQITTINGQTRRVVRNEFVLRLQLTAKRQGTMTIPSLPIQAQGETKRTRPIQVRVLTPEKAKDQILDVTLAKTSCYVGEPVKITWTWYVNQRVEGFSFVLPVLDMPDFEFPEYDLQVTPGQERRFLRIPLSAGREAIARQDRARRNGTNWTAVRFEKMLVPKKAGTFVLPESTVSSDVVTGYDRSGFPDSFFSTRKALKKREMAVSGKLTLVVRDVPKAGMPDTFCGHIGRYRITASAKPTNVNVGDPIEVTLVVSGALLPNAVKPPPLDKQRDLTEAFRVSGAADAATITGGTAVFTRILRPLNPDVQQIPPLELPYFDSGRGEYVVARTAPIPVEVRAAHVITAHDAQGVSPVGQTARKLEVWSQGISHNYEDLSALKNQQTGLDVWLHSPLWLTALVGPPLVFALLACSLAIWSALHSNPEVLRARQAKAQARRLLKQLDCSADAAYADILTALRVFLGGKLHLAAGALTFADAVPKLREAGVPDEVLAALESAFQDCEAGRYAGGMEAKTPAALADHVLSLIEAMDRTLK